MSQPDHESTITQPLGPLAVSSALEVGLELVLAEQEAGGLSPLARWLATNPDQAADLARFLATEQHVQQVLTPTTVRGMMVAEFELGEEIGQGGMGIVYRAYDTALKRDVALKQIPANYTPTPQDRARFRYEAEVVAALDHPHIVRVYRFGEWNGVPYLVMPLMTGGSLATKLKEGGSARLPLTTVAQLTHKIALGVQHAHERGLLHRDLKPANILLDRDGQPHVADFGLARRADATMTTIAGTPAYMAPEQARGDKHLTTATDIHAIGAMLFEMLTGGPPYGKGEFASVMRRVVDDPVPSIRRYQPDVPTALEYICLKCLEKEPRDRYSSAQAIADDLARYLAGEEVGQSGRVTLSAVVRTLGRRRDSFQAMPSWRIAYWGAGNSLVTLSLLQWAVCHDPAGWPTHAALALYMVGWIVVVWCFWMRQATALTRGESGTMALHIGMFLAAFSIIATQLWQHDGNVLPIFPPLGVVLGLSLYAHGLVFWGRLYVVGVLAMLMATAMPLFPSILWPSVYGLTVTVAQLWAGLHVRRAETP